MMNSVERVTVPILITHVKRDLGPANLRVCNIDDCRAQLAIEDRAVRKLVFPIVANGHLAGGQDVAFGSGNAEGDLLTRLSLVGVNGCFKKRNTERWVGTILREYSRDSVAPKHKIVERDAGMERDVVGLHEAFVGSGVSKVIECQ